MSRGKKNLAINTVLFLQMAAMAATGVIIKWVLPPGSGGGRHGWRHGWHHGGGPGWRHGGGPGWRHGGGGGGWFGGEGCDGASFLGLTRHQWGDVHFWIALSLIALLVVHLVLHWRWVVCQVKSLLPERRGRDGESCADEGTVTAEEPSPRQSFRPSGPGQPLNPPPGGAGFQRHSERPKPKG